MLLLVSHVILSKRKNVDMNYKNVIFVELPVKNHNLDVNYINAQDAVELRLWFI